MPGTSSVFKQTYQKYLKEIQALDLTDLAQRLGLTPCDDAVVIRFLETDYLLSAQGFHTHSNKSAPYDLSIVLCRYLLMCPQTAPHRTDLVSFRDFKDSGPLLVYFSNEVEMKISRFFSGRTEDLTRAAMAMGGQIIDIGASYDVSVRFNALPKIPVVLLFNDRDDEFEAQANLLFEQRAGSYLDAECLAILGNLLYQTLSSPRAQET